MRIVASRALTIPGGMAFQRHEPMVFPRKLLSRSHEPPHLRFSPRVADVARASLEAVDGLLESRPAGLTATEVQERLRIHGPNMLARDSRPSLARLLVRALRDPLVLLLGALATLSLATGDARAAGLMLAMILLSVVLRLYQEAKATSAAAQLRAMLTVKATVLREGNVHELPVAQLVPGDRVELSAGDMIPGDVRLVQAKDLFVVQGSLTGESFPVEKFAVESRPDAASPLEWTSIAYLGTSVSSGSAKAVVVATGKDTYLGHMAEALAEVPGTTAFDRGLSRFTRLMLTFMAVMVPLVFVVNGVTKGQWGEAFFFALAVAVGLTPEMLPMIVTICLSKGALAMGKKRVIVKRLHAIQNLGAMDVLCTDKTGTLTRDEILLERHCDVALREDDNVLALAYLNSHFQTGLKSVLDRAILKHEEAHGAAGIPLLEKVDEIPFDFQRRVMSVVVRTVEGNDRIVSKGAPEAVFDRCTTFRLDGQLHSMDHPHIEELRREYESLSSDGFRVLAIATKEVLERSTPTAHGTAYGTRDECDLVLEGYVAFLDPPKETAATALKALERHGVRVKVLTGDNELVARKVCRDVGLDVSDCLLGEDVERLGDEELARAAERAVLFARVSPAHKQRIVQALQRHGHTVGFMGDGINDAPALHAADVGISVDTAVDLAKESAEVILLEKSLMVLDEGVLEGRKVFSNVVKYVRMGASSNFGNMFSVLGASVFVPFLPMRPVQILANNLLYDVGQAAIPTDNVDVEQVLAPRSWNMNELTRFILFIGPCSSLFDYTTYFVMLKVFGCSDVSTAAARAHSQSLFQTGWFVESLLTQTLIIHVIRTNKLPFLESRSSTAVALTSLALALTGIGLPLTALGRALGFMELPLGYWPILAVTLLSYVVVTQGAKSWLLRREWI